MFIVTGAAGFIGSQLSQWLFQHYHEPILAVDQLIDGYQFRNLLTHTITDYLDKDDFLKRIQENQCLSKKITAVFHQGACTDTTEWNGQYMMANNYEYSKALLHYCLRYRIPFIYASSAAVYGLSTCFKEEPAYEQPLNVYGYSKLLFDRYVRYRFPDFQSPVVGLRYFNAYGPGESHKKAMASVIYHFNRQVLETGQLSLFSGTDDYADGEQTRDFIHVNDIAAVNSWFLEHPEHSGIFNCGTGQSRTFNDVAKTMIQWHGTGQINYIPFPKKLRGHYQHHTEADMSSLHKLGYSKPFMPIEQGIPLYLEILNKANL